MESKLMPCPFCGGEVRIVDFGHKLTRPSHNHPYSVYCGYCELLYGYDVDYGGIFDTEEEAAEYWNGRVEADDHK